MITGLVGLVLLGLVLAFMSYFVRGDNFPRNRAIGIRTKATLSSEAAWTAGHRAAAPWLLTSGLAALFPAALSGAAVFAGIGDDEPWVVAALIIMGYVAMMVMLVAGAVVANRAARAA